ncbi:peptidoglycan-binding protein [Marilutibacter chinensis]|uniref:Peptidoglycan-binding protein n=1 Tax=Marilutibacter chinensis TaxID=2912247 RepID=A0ABS9HTX0_9GAMM|nr:peptidoglycan-binding protein [Lysobacter chinensis]MCF7221615.1 peptidoglycan-binding protein [Lysobacter chinensis]
MTDDQAPSTYRIIQLGPPRPPNGLQSNEPVTDFDSLATHHPGANRDARMQDGVIINGQPRRAHAYIGGELQEIEVARDGRTFGLNPDQVLLKKDFILEDPNHPSMSRAARAVDVPSPVSGYIGRVSEREGLVDILDRQGGDVVARIRHMNPIAVSEGQTVEYGDALGTQGRQQTGAVHVHMEMDTRYYQQFENYVSDLVSGRLPVEAEHRENVEPQQVVGDGTFRLGETNQRIRDLQRVMANEGYQAVGGRPLDQDGVYRVSMQGALLDFQREHGIPQTGDIDPATLHFAPLAHSREVDRQDHFMQGQPMPPAAPERPPAPGHPDHPDHRSGLPQELEQPINRHSQRTGSTGDPQLDRLADALYADNDDEISRVCAEIEQSPDVQAMVQQGHEMLAAQERERQQQEVARQNQGHVLSLG